MGSAVGRLLTIGIPTYRRAAKLDRQLAWLDRNIAGHEADCQIVLSDNGSPDDTEAVCQKWAAAFTARGVPIIVRRNPENIGAVPNIAQCFTLAEGRFVWAIGDDDDIDAETFGWLIATLKQDPDLAVVFINYRTAGKDVHERCYSFDADRQGDGKAIFEECFRQREWGLGFMTAEVFRTEYVQGAMRAWPEGVRNFDYTIWLIGHAGLQGRVLITADPRATYVTGDSIYVSNKRAAMSMCADEIEILVRLGKAGYDQALMRAVARKKLRHSAKKLARTAMHVNPALTARSMARLASYMAVL